MESEKDSLFKSSFSKFIDCSRQWPQFAYIVMAFITIVAAL